MTQAQDAYRQLIDHVRETRLLDATASLLGWDQEVMMPPGGVEFRGRQLGQLARLEHTMATDPRVGGWLAACEADAGAMGDPLSPPAVNVREIHRNFDRSTKLPTALVVELAETTSAAKHIWAQARQASDFPRFAPWLTKIVQLARDKAACFGHPAGGEPWDALAEEYEPGCGARDIAAVFTPLRQRLVRLLDDLMGKGRAPSAAFNALPLPIDSQERFVRAAADAIGFDFTRGRLDRSTHPFCSGTHCHDVRLTTRFHEDNLLDALGSTMHEAGHGMYEQGLPAEHIGTPMGSAVSLAIHESQSRMWENQVGRSRPFWQWAHPLLAQHFGAAVRGIGLDEVHAAANVVKPTLIRVEADEVTYNLHVMVRFELERALIAGDLAVADLPAAWNQKYKEYLRLDVPDDRRGCLQDIHWSMGAIGYFPTYTLGNLHAAQLFEAASRDIPDLPAQFAEGEFGWLRTWLADKVYRHGQRRRSLALCRSATGAELSADPLLRHLEGKFRAVYGV